MLGLGALILVQSLLVPSATSPVGADAVWAPPANFLQRFHQACDGREGDAFTSCFLDAMRKAGAPPAALAFARRVDGMGYLRAFDDSGRVGLAYAEFPFRANENQLCFLVNGAPPLLDVDDLSRLDRAQLAANPDYAALARTYPNVTVFPGRRSGAHGPRPMRLHNGGQAFSVPYTLHDGCHACRIVGDLELRWDFDVEGRLAGIRIQRVRARPQA
ncbi:MAG TPA: hypothetical protein VGH97_12990 [Thermoanaerobaculia bacterium]|jgi:hypothetical protein